MRLRIAGSLAMTALLAVGSQGLADPPHKTKLAVSAFVDSVNRFGDGVEVESDFHTLASLRFEWTVRLADAIHPRVKRSKIGVSCGYHLPPTYD
jgi:hypothetical protein